jgi:hypothetical protein
MSNVMRAHPLVGKWFHSFDHAGNLLWQGTIRAEPNPGYYLVLRYEWLVGMASTEILVPITEMGGWVFYNSAAEMNHAFDLYELRQLCREKPARDNTYREKTR